MSLFDKKHLVTQADALPGRNTPMPIATLHAVLYDQCPCRDGDRLLRYGLFLGRRTFILAIARRI